MSKPIKDIETINKIKEMYIKKNKKRDLLLFLLAINTGKYGSKTERFIKLKRKRR